MYRDGETESIEMERRRDREYRDGERVGKGIPVVE